MAKDDKDRPKAHATGFQRIRPIRQENGRIMCHNHVNANRLIDGPDPWGCAVCVPTGSDGKIIPRTLSNKDIIMVTHYSFSVLPSKGLNTSDRGAVHRENVYLDCSKPFKKRHLFCSKHPFSMPHQPAFRGAVHYFLYYFYRFRRYFQK